MLHIFPIFLQFGTCLLCGCYCGISIWMFHCISFAPYIPNEECTMHGKHRFALKCPHPMYASEQITSNGIWWHGDKWNVLYATLFTRTPVHYTASKRQVQSHSYTLHCIAIYVVVFFFIWKKNKPPLESVQFDECMQLKSLIKLLWI